MLQELISHALLFGVFVASGLDFSGAVLLLVADLLLMTLLSIPVHRAYSLGYYLRKLLLLLGLLVFLLLMCSIAYRTALGDGEVRFDAAFFARLLAFEPELLVWMIVLSTLHLAVKLGYAYLQREPRRAWDQITAIASVATLLSLFFLTFVILLLGEPAIALARRFDPTPDPETVLIALMVGLRLTWCCLLLLTPPPSLRELAVPTRAQT